jgi:hypothetical protein
MVSIPALAVGRDATQADLSRNPALAPPPPRKTIACNVTVTMDAGPVYAYDPDAPDSHTSATNQQVFTSDFSSLSLASVHCTRDDTDLRVFFWTDLAGDSPGRISVILVLGRLWDKILGFGHPYAAAANLGPFTLVIKRDGRTVYNQHFPQLGWFTSWIWRSTPRPIVRNGATLLAAGLIPPFSTTLAKTYATTVPNGPNLPFAVMIGSTKNPSGVNDPCFNASGVPVIPTYMGGVGASSGIGIVTNQQAYWVLNNDAASQKAMLLTADAALGLPWLFQDELNNWQPPNILNDTTYKVFVGAGYIKNVPVPAPTSGNNWSIAADHVPSFCYVPYLVTGDPYYLLGMQCQTSFMFMTHTHRNGSWPLSVSDPNAARAVMGSPQPMLNYNSDRAFAWSLRDVVYNYMAAQGNPPNWLLPKSVYKAISDQNQIFFDHYNANNHRLPPNGYPVAQLYGGYFYMGGNAEQGFMRAYLLLAMFAATELAGLANWRDAYDYIFRALLNMTNGISGWNKRFPDPYYWLPQPASNDSVASPGQFTSWLEIWDYFRSTNTGLSGCAIQYPGSAAPQDRNFSGWRADTPYQCNSFMFQLRGGIGSEINVMGVGDTIRLTVAGRFPGSPMTVMRAIMAGDANGSTHPIADGIIAGINENRALMTAGITASKTISMGPGVGLSLPSHRGRAYLSFNGAAVGPLSVTGAVTPGPTPGGESWYIQPNGDGVFNDIDPNLFGRVRNYSCAVNGTSASSGGPTGTGKLIADGSAKWCFCPEGITDPVYPPFTDAQLSAIKEPLWFRPQYPPPYLTLPWAAAACAAKAGLTGASSSYSWLTKLMNDFVAHTQRTDERAVDWNCLIGGT